MFESVTPIKWSEKVGDELRPALGASYDLIRLECETGGISIYRFRGMLFCVRIERLINAEREMVVVAAVGRGASELMEFLAVYCEENKIRSIRFHTHYAKQLRDKFININLPGFQFEGAVYRREVIYDGR